jgi:integrase
MTLQNFNTELKYIRNVSPTTLELYKYAFRQFNGALESKETVIKRVGELREKGIKPVSVNTYLRCLNAYFNWLHKEHNQPLIKISKLKEERVVLATLQPGAVKAIVQWRPQTTTQKTLHSILCLLLDTGLRIDEALSLTPQDVDFDNLVIKVRGKGGKHRIVPFSFELRKLLWRYAQQFPGPYVFSTKRVQSFHKGICCANFKSSGKSFTSLASDSVRTRSVIHLRAIGFVRVETFLCCLEFWGTVISRLLLSISGASGLRTCRRSIVGYRYLGTEWADRRVFQVGGRVWN